VLPGALAKCHPGPLIGRCLSKSLLTCLFHRVIMRAEKWKTFRFWALTRERRELDLIDTHAHLDEIEDLSGAVERAREVGIRAVVAVGSDLRSNEKILEAAGKFPGFVLPALGLHPWRLTKDDVEANFRLMEPEIPKCVAIGEVGLDFAIDTPREIQEEVFSRILAMAARLKKPVLLHARRAWEETLVLVKHHQIEKAVFHWYSGPGNVLERIVNSGYFISATPAAAYSERHRQAIRSTSLKRLLLETDAPESYRGKRSEPRDLLTSLAAVSDLQGRTREEVGAETSRNARAFFKLDDFINAPNFYFPREDMS
jgi:TatD DNase family protein